MKGFSFKLQSVLNVKAIEENRLLEEYALLKNAHAETVERLNQLEIQKSNQLLNIEDSEVEGAVDVTWAQIQRNYLNHLRREILITTEEKHRRKMKMDEGLARLVDKTKERKILEKLKEKHKAIFVADQLKRMQKELDDLAQGRFNHQKSKHLEAKT